MCRCCFGGGGDLPIPDDETKRARAQAVHLPPSTQRRRHVFDMRCRRSLECNFALRSAMRMLTDTCVFLFLFFCFFSPYLRRQYLAKLPLFLASALGDVLVGMQFADFAWKGKGAKADGTGKEMIATAGKVQQYSSVSMRNEQTLSLCLVSSMLSFSSMDGLDWLG